MADYFNSRAMCTPASSQPVMTPEGVVGFMPYRARVSTGTFNTHIFASSLSSSNTSYHDDFLHNNSSSNNDNNKKTDATTMRSMPEPIFVGGAPAMARSSSQSSTTSTSSTSSSMTSSMNAPNYSHWTFGSAHRRPSFATHATAYVSDEDLFGTDDVETFMAEAPAPPRCAEAWNQQPVIQPQPQPQQQRPQPPPMVRTTTRRSSGGISSATAAERIAAAQRRRASEALRRRG